MIHKNSLSSAKKKIKHGKEWIVSKGIYRKLLTTQSFTILPVKLLELHALYSNVN